MKESGIPIACHHPEVQGKSRKPAAAPKTARDKPAAAPKTASDKPCKASNASQIEPSQNASSSDKLAKKAKMEI